MFYYYNDNVILITTVRKIKNKIRLVFGEIDLLTANRENGKKCYHLLNKIKLIDLYTYLNNPIKIRINYILYS